MTVHDSILFDWDGLNDFDVAAIKATLNRTSEIITEYYGIKMPVMLSVGQTSGPNWGDMV
jgi:hypothetical protein